MADVRLLDMEQKPLLSTIKSPNLKTADKTDVAVMFTD